MSQAAISRGLGHRAGLPANARAGSNAVSPRGHPPGVTATRVYSFDARVTPVGASALTGLYSRALSAQGLVPESFSAKNCTIAELAPAAGALTKVAE